MTLPERTPLHELTAAEAARRIREGTLTARALVSACLDRIKQLEPSLKAWAHLNPEQGLEQARAVDTALGQGKDPGPLAGIPIGIKDIFNTADMPTQMGSPLWSSYTPGNDARVVSSIRQAGGIILGKTVTAEFAVHAPGPTVNPHNPEYSPGTSSSGSAVAVAVGMVPLGLGSQTAGSVIRPASYCGIYGFKPSFGLIPRTGSLKTTDTLDTVAFLSRYPEDLELLFEAVRAKGRNYPLAETLLNDPARRKLAGRPWRIAFVKGPRWSHAKEYARDALLKFVSELAGMKEISVEEKTLPPEMTEAHLIHEMIYNKALSYYFKQEFLRKEGVSLTLQELIQSGQKISTHEYRQALQRQADLARLLDRWFQEEADLLLTLSTSGEAPKGLDTPDCPDNCLVWTLCGVPTINLPLFTSPSGLPFGAQIVARRYGDFRLLEFARTFSRKESVEVVV